MPTQPSLHRAVRRLGSSAIGTGLFGSPASLTALNRACRYGAASEAKCAASRSPLWLKFGLGAPPPLLLGCLPCRVAGVAGRLLFSLKQRISLCLFGSVSGCLLGRRALGVGCCLRCKLSLLHPVALFA
jgi:hypothetical protein